jgi:hypothetical protein
MQILIFEDATCVLNIYMIVAPGFVSNLLCKWIRSAANGNETLSTLRERNLCVNSPCHGRNSLILQCIVHVVSVKYIKASGPASSIYVIGAVVYSLWTFAKSTGFFPYSFYYICLAKKRTFSGYHHVRACSDVWPIQTLESVDRFR